MPRELETPPGDDCNRWQASLRVDKTLDAVPESSIQKLLPEILATIFQYTCPTPDFHESLYNYARDGSGGLRQSRQHFSLAAVSSIWRQVVYSTPQLWTSVVLRHDDAQFLELHTARSGSLHLELEIWTSPWFRPSLAGCHLLPKIAPKLRSLILVNPGDGAMEYISNIELPFLKRLGILCHEGVHEFRCLKLAGAPVLQHLSFKVESCTESCFDISCFELPWSSVTSLDLEWIPIPVCVTALHQCQNLVEFRCEEDRDSPEHILRATLSLPHLKQLSWPYLRGTTIHNLLRHFHTPVLQSLLLGYAQPIDETWIDFFRNLPPTFRKLQLYTFRSARTATDRLDPARFFKHVPHLEELVLERCAKSFIDDVFAALSLSESSTGGPFYLPKLRTLVIGPHSNSTQLSDVRHGMSVMIEKRFASQAGVPTYSISAVNSSWEGAFRGPFQGTVLVIDEEGISAP